MRSKYSVKLKTIVKEHNLTVLHASSNYENQVLTTADVNRPALQLTGFYDYFDPTRLQTIGRVEMTYLNTLSASERYRALDTFFQHNISALIVAHDVEVLPEIHRLAVDYDRNLFRTSEDTSTFLAKVISSLHNHLAPRITTHGVLVEVYGEGVLITGDSGIGKTETALELIKRGHRLIADDAVEIKLVDKSLTASAPEMIRYYMELRGIGVINVKQLYGVGAIKPYGGIDLVAHLEPWEEGKAYDRLGLSEECEDILGVKLPRVTIPVRPGRNLAVILELAAMNNRQKKMGFNAAEMLASAHDSAIDSGLMF